jgi:hypothetical protein
MLCCASAAAAKTAVSAVDLLTGKEDLDPNATTIKVRLTHQPPLLLDLLLSLQQALCPNLKT